MSAVTYIMLIIICYRFDVSCAVCIPYHLDIVCLCRGYSCYARATITLINFANEKDNHSKGVCSVVCTIKV